MKEFSMDGYLKSNLDIAKIEIRRDWDMIFCVDGPEGSGKSVFSMQAAWYCYPKFTIDNIAFNPNQFRRCVLGQPKYSAIVYDEAYTGLSSRATMSVINRALVSMLTEIRQKNLFIFVVLPCFFDLDKYVALWRSRILIHVYTHGFQRGYFSFFNYDKKKELYLLGKKFYSYFKPKSNFIGRFTNTYVVDEVEYRKRKNIAASKREEDRIKQEIVKEQQIALFERLVERQDIPDRIKAEIICISEPTYYRWLNSYKENRENFSDVGTISAAEPVK
jgi:hypothetical protein